jgi:membrane protein
MFLITSIRIVYRAFEKWSEDGGLRLGAALAYYALFSIPPLVLISVHITGAVFGEEAARGEIKKQLIAMMGEDVAGNVQGMIKQASEPQDTSWTPTVSALFLIIAALGAFLHMRGALCTIWKIEPPRGNGWLGMVWDYVLSVGMVFLLALLLLISIAVGLAIPVFRKMVHVEALDDGQFWRWFEVVTAFVFHTVLFAISYRTLSGGQISWGYVWYGSFIAAILFTLGRTLLSYYIEYSNPASMYGAAGSIVIFLIWVYYSSQVLFFGAELIQARRTRYEWLYGEPKPGDANGSLRPGAN